jgi:hypothetical protein
MISASGGREGHRIKKRAAQPPELWLRGSRRAVLLRPPFDGFEQLAACPAAFDRRISCEVVQMGLPLA